MNLRLGFGLLIVTVLGAACDSDDSSDDTTGASATTGSTTDATTGETSSTSTGGSTSTTTGDTDASSGGDPTVPENTCEPRGAPCIDCITEACCDQLTACLEDELCSCVITCIDEGGDQEGCTTACGGDAANDAINGYFECSAASCADDCGG